MQRKGVQALNRRLLDKFLINESECAPTETRVPADIFFDPALFVREKELLFRTTPQPIAFSAEIPEPNCFLALEVLDIPVVLTRNQNGVLKAYLNACPHRGGKIACGAGQKKLLTCEFHGWSFSPDGDLVARPQEDCFSSDKSEHGLSELPVAEHCGIVVLGLNQSVRVDPEQAGFESIVEELSDYSLHKYKSLDRRTYEVAANWKLVNDLSLESYHFPVLHRDSVATVLSASSVFDTFGQCSRWAFPWLTIGRLEKLAEEDWPDTLEGSCTYTLFPGVMVILNSSGAQMIRAEPGDHAGQSRVHFVGLAHPDTDEKEARQGFEFGGKVFVEEDLQAAENCQKGLGVSRRDLIIGTNEPLLQFWHDLWADSTP
ncbi:MAG: aromatic ring-hydroxylating oxygenase subunit alpha [Parvibaculales bacterium]